MKKLDTKKFRSGRPSPLWIMLGATLLVAALVALLIRVGAPEKTLQLLNWIDAQGYWGPLLFILIMAAAVVLLLPGILFTTGAGFVFGVVQGSIVVVLGTTLGATLAFLIARHLFGARARHYVRNHPRLALVSEEMAARDWLVVLLTRLIPFFPSKISNYFFGLTPFSLRGFVAGSLLGFIPFSVHNVYLGSIAGDIATLGQRHVGRTPLDWTVYGLGFVVTIGVVIYLQRLAKRALDRYRDETARGKTP